MSSSGLLSSSNLYRIVSFDRAVQILQSNTLYFAHPSEWDDPYEQGLLHKRSNNVFAQCWCRKAVSDAMWRIYSPNNLGVRIGTTRPLLHATLKEAQKTQGIRFKIQNVKYMFQEDLNFALQDVATTLNEKYTVRKAIEPLFMKRNAFHHEYEVRAVVYDREPQPTDNGKGVVIPVDSQTLIRSIWIDPRAPKEHVEAYTLYLKKKLKFQGVVKKSTLYEAPEQIDV